MPDGTHGDRRWRRRAGRERPAWRQRARARSAGWALAAALGLGLLTVIATTPLGHGVHRLTARLAGWARPRAVSAPAALGNSTTVSARPAVGALFTLTAAGQLGSHFCTASVVDSPSRDLLVTAAHCVSNPAKGAIAFVPGYRNGQAPYGIWPITSITVDDSWASSADPDDDVAFLAASRAGPVRLEDVTGAERLGIAGPAGQLVTVTGYPGTSDAPISCANRTRAFSPTQLEFDCPGYTDGTSGSALLADANPVSGLGTVIGVIGGYQQGGDTAAVSYAARFGPNVAALYRTAVAQG